MSNKAVKKRSLVKKLEDIEKLNYYLYLLIVLFIGIVFFTASYFTTEKTLKVANINEVDSALQITDVEGLGFDLEIKSRNEVKIRIYVGTDPQQLSLFYEVEEYVREYTQQYRTPLNGRTRYLQVEFEKKDGTKLISQIQEVTF
jgi:short subunit dehydrogenase-like uncharacterized protein